MTLTVSERDSQLVIDSRLIASELGIEHSSLLKTVRENQTEIEQDFERVRFEILPLETKGGTQNSTVAYLTEDQATYVMSLSRNTDQVRLAKRNLVKAFSKAKAILQGTATVDSDIVAALMNRLDRLDSVAIVSQEYLDLRKYASKVMPGLVELTDAILDSNLALPQAIVYFTAIEWVDGNARHLSKRQKICFFKEIAAAHRFLVGSMPEKIRGKYQYTNRHEILFNRVREIAENMIPSESVQKSLTPAHNLTYEELSRLTLDEQALIGESMKLTTLSTCLGYRISNLNTVLSSKLGMKIKSLVKSGVVDKPRGSMNNKQFVVTPTLIEAVKKFHTEVTYE